MIQVNKTKPLTNTQIAWAKQHSWFRKVLNTTEGRVILATSNVITQRGKIEGNVIVTGNFKELLNWAGY